MKRSEAVERLKGILLEEICRDDSGLLYISDYDAFNILTQLEERLRMIPTYRKFVVEEDEYGTVSYNETSYGWEPEDETK